MMTLFFLGALYLLERNYPGMSDEWYISLQGVADNVALVKIMIFEWRYQDSSRLVQYFAVDIGIEGKASVLWNNRRQYLYSLNEQSQLIVAGSNCLKISDELIQVL